MLYAIRKNRENIAKAILISMIMFFALPFALTGVDTYSAKGKTTEAATEAGSEAKGLEDFNISMDSKNGKSSLTIKGLDGDSDKTWNTIFEKYHNVIIGISGVACLTFIVFFIINFVKVAGSSTNPAERGKAITGCIWTGVAMACCGAVTVIAAIFWNAIK